MGILRASYDYTCGRRLEALASLEALSGVLARVGYVLGEMGMKIMRARLLFVLGSAARARVLLAEVETVARARRLENALRMAARSHGLDPLVLASSDEEPELASWPPGLRSHVLAWAALRAAKRGDLGRARPLLVDAQIACPTRGADWDRALVHLGTWLVARRDARPDDATLELDRARELAAQCGVDRDLLETIVARVSANSAGPADDGATGLVLDEATHVLRAGSHRISLASRPILRRLLYVLAERPATIVDKEGIARAVWGRGYNPLTDDTPIRVNVKRLRDLLAQSDLRVAYDDGGYRLDVPASFRFHRRSP
jgi:hypothetical protein